ncbi:MAG: pantoate--beta-alanine ligase [Gammaproteobacteria bacterium]|nr:pantoate--beta-alanine ligase [Gammaproteobacteria bacterium]
MNVIHNKNALDELLVEWRHNDEHIALVPTMGNLHPGHISLVELAREHAERVVVSIFVNPTQFGDGEDFDDYPRTLERDKRRLQKVGVDAIFVPDVDTMYPFGLEDATTVSVPRLTENFCGASRPGHFDGVTSVVARLFGLVQPDAAVFGQKDYQQQLVIRHMSQDLNLPVQVITGETVREESGLAMSSRNQYLDDDEKQTAASLYEVLLSAGTELQSGKRDYERLESDSVERLTELGFTVDYFAIRRAQNLGIPDRDCDELVVLTAAHLGDARLIDNIVVTI